MDINKVLFSGLSLNELQMMYAADLLRSGILRGLYTNEELSLVKVDVVSLLSKDEYIDYP